MTTPRIVVARAPLRVSLAGGGTDLPSYAEQFGGLVISLAIDRYVCVTVYPREFRGTLRAALEHTETVSHADELTNRFARAAMRRAGQTTNIQLASFADAPSGTGLGGSGAFTVALMHALLYHQDPRAEELAEHASAIEMVDLERPVGKHDHYMAALGGLHALHIGRTDIHAEPFAMTEAIRSYVEERLLLFYTGQSRDAGQVLTSQDKLTRQRNDAVMAPLHGIRALAQRLLDSLREGRVADVGPTLDEHWRYKLRLSDRVTTPRVERLYDVAMEAGAEGGKLLGAGGGGFLLMAAHDGEQDQVRKAMFAEGATELPFAAAPSGSTASGLDL